MNCCRETPKMGVPARHRPPEAESGEAGGPPWHFRGTRDRSQGPTPEDARKDGHIIRPRSAPLSLASGFPVSLSAVGGFLKYPG
jgi:hypothetical protein